MSSFFRGLLTAIWLLAVLAPASADDVVVVVVGPLSGPLSQFGNQVKSGVGQAVRDINERGGVLGKKIALDLQDDQCSPPRAVEAAHKIVANTKPALVIGHLCDATSAATVQIYSNAGTLQISPAPMGHAEGFNFAPNQSSKSQEILAKLRSQSIAPERYVLSAYAIVQSWAEAANQSRTLDAVPIVKKLRSTKFDTVIGELRFDSLETSAQSELVFLVQRSATTEPECPTCPKSGACPQRLAAYEKKCECSKSGACPQ